MKLKIKYILAAVAIATAFSFIGWQLNSSQAIAGYDKDNLIRFHVVANSNSAQDQALKFKVRDTVLKGMTPHLKDIENASKAREVVKNNMNYIKELARSEVKNHNLNYRVSVSMDNYSFPAKSYKIATNNKESDYLTLPQGKYEAVRIVIGEGQGANWWCVLYPPLCFVNNGSDGKDKEKTGQEELNQQEAVKAFELNTPPPSKDNEEKESSIKFKFKTLEIFNNNFSNKSKT